MECANVSANAGYGALGYGPVIALLPRNIALGSAQLNLFFGGLKASAQISVVPSSFGLFTQLFAQAYGLGPALAQQVAGDHVLVKNELTHPAKPGDYVVLWGTGLGSATRDQVNVNLGGKPASVSYAGPAPGEPGVDIINFVVPNDASIPNDCYVAVWVEAAGVKSNSSSISKTDDGSACHSSLGLTATDLASRDAGFTVGLAQLNLSARIAPLATVTRQGDFSSFQGQSGLGAFARTESANFTPWYLDAPSIAQISGAVTAGDAILGCSAATQGPFATEEFISASEVIDFGSKVTLRSNELALDLTTPSVFYSPYIGRQTSPTVLNPNTLPAPLFAPGVWTFSGVGGSSESRPAAGAAFTQTLVVPPEIQATNFDALQSISRQQDQTITWNPAGLSEKDIVRITLLESISQELFPSQEAITCVAPASTGQLVVPSTLLQNFAARTLGGGATLTLVLTRNPRYAQRFALPLSDGSSLPAVFNFSSSETWPVAVQ
jgi:hypothetical protein